MGAEYMGLFGPVGSEKASKMTDALFGSTADSKRYVRPMLQIGSIVRVNYGEDLNKLATVVDIIDSGRLLVEGPENLTGVPRKVLTIKRMTLTGLGVGITRNARQKQLNKAWKDAGIQESGTSLHTPRRSRGAQLVLPSTISIASRSCSRASRSPRSLPALSGRCASPPSKLDCSLVRSTI